MATPGLGIGVDEAVASMVRRRSEEQAAQEAQALVELERLRRERTRDRSRSIGEIAGDTGLGLLSGAVGLGQAAYGLGNIATAGFLDEATGGFSQNFGETTEALQGMQSEPLQLRREDANAAFDEGLLEGAAAYATDPSLMGDLAAQALPSLIPTVGAGSLAARTVGAVGTRQAAQRAGTRAAIGAGGAQIAGTTNVEAVDTLREQGVEGLERQALGVGAGLAAGTLGAGISAVTGAGALEAAVGGRLAGLGAQGVGGMRGVARGVAGGVAREGTEEAVQSATEQASVNLVAPDNELLDDTGRAAVMGGLGGAVLGGPLGGIASTGRTAAQAGTQQAAAVAQQEQDTLAQTLDRATREGQMPQGGLRALIDQQVEAGGADGLSEQDFRTAVDVELVRRGATTRLDDDGNPVIMRANPNTQTLEPIPDTERQQVEQELQAYLDGTTESDTLFGEPAPEPAGQTGETGEDLALSGEADPLDLQIRARADELRAADPALDEQVALTQAATELDPQLDLDFSQEEQELYTLGQSLQQNEILFENDDGSLTVNENQRELFDQATQGMTSEQQDEFIQNIARTRERVREQGMRVQERVNRIVGVDREPAVSGQQDVLSRQAAQRQERERRQEEVIAQTFRVEEGEDGPVYRRYNEDLQAMEEVPRSVAVREANRILDEQDAAAAEAARPPADRWKDTLAERFGLKKQTLQSRNKEWQAFSEAANDRGIQPDSPEAETFLAEQAASLGADEAGAGRLGATLGEWLAEQQGDTQAAVEEDPALALQQAQEPAPEVQQAVATEAAVDSTRTPRAQEELASVATAIDQRVMDDLAREVPAGQSPSSQRRSALHRQSLETELDLATSAEELDQTFSAILKTRAWQAMDQQTQRQVTSKYAAMYDRMEPGRYLRVNARDNTVVDTRTAAQREAGDPAAPSRSPTRRERRAERKRQREQTSTPLTAERAAELLAGESVTTHATVADYKQATRRPAPPDAAGVFDRSGVHVVLENVRSEEQLAEVLAHERAHGGLATLLGDRLPAVTNRLWANAALRERIRNKMQTQSLDRSVAAEEVLADMLAANERLTGDVWSKLRSGISSVFESILGVGSYRITDRQVDRLLDDVSRQMREGAAYTRNSALTEGEIPLDALLGEPTAVTSTPRFSRAVETLNSTVPKFEPVAGNHNRLDAAVKEATDASVNRFRDVWERVKDGYYGRAAAGLTMPLNQMVNMWGRNFDRVVRNDKGDIIEVDNPFKRLSRLKGEQEARLNQRVVRKRDIEAEGRKFNVSAHNINDEATAYQQSNPEGATDLNVTLQDSTRFQVWPNRTWDEQPSIDYERHNLTEQERRDAYKDLRQRWNRMGPKGQDLYLKIQASYADIWQSRIEALESELRRVNGLQPGDPLPDNRLLEMARREMTGGPYSPLSRVGQYLVQVQGPQGVEHFSAYETLTEAKYAEQGLRKDYPSEDGFAVSRTVQASRDNLRAGLNQEQLNILENALQNAVPDSTDQATKAAIHDAMIETYLKMIPASSFGQYSNRRRNVSGYSMDGLRAFSNYAVKGARQIASIEYDGQISEGLLQMRQHIRDKAADGQNVDLEQDVYNKVSEHHQASLESNFNEMLAKLSGAGFLYYMTSPSQLFVNATQTFIVAMPRLAARYGADKTWRIGREALNNYFRSGRDFLGERATSEGAIDPATRDVMQRLYDDGTLDFTLTGDLLEVAQAESGQLSSTWRRTMQYLASPIHKSEVFNRQVTAYMATKMHAEQNGIDLNNASDEQLQQLYDVAKDAVDSTQFNYSQSNKPVIMQGPIKRLVMQFQQYRLNMLAMMAKDLRDSFGGNNASPEEKRLARRSLAYLLGSQLAFTGAVGTAMAPIAFAIMDAFGDDDEDFVDSRTAFIEAVPQWFAHGLIGGVLNLDPGRVEVGSVLPFLGERAYAPNTDDFSETASYYLERNIGPWFGLTTGAIGGVKKAMSGDFYEAGQGLLPKPMADAWRSVHEVDGVRNANGVITYDTGAWDFVTRALGMRSAGAMRSSVRQGAGYQVAKNVQRQRQNRLVELATAQATGDREAYSEAIGRINDWNDKNPEFAIQGQDIGRILTSQARAQRNVEDFGLPLSRDITPGFQRAAGI